MVSDRALRYFPSALKMALLLVVFTGFVAVCYWMVSVSASRGSVSRTVIGYVGITFFGLDGLVALWLLLGRLIVRRPWLVVDSYGISCYIGHKLRTTHWDQISDIAIYRQRLSRGNSQYYLVVGARDESAVEAVSQLG